MGIIKRTVKRWVQPQSNGKGFGWHLDAGRGFARTLCGIPAGNWWQDYPGSTEPPQEIQCQECVAEMVKQRLIGQSSGTETGRFDKQIVRNAAQAIINEARRRAQATLTSQSQSQTQPAQSSTSPHQVSGGSSGNTPKP